jgi:hypothetical protein
MKGQDFKFVRIHSQTLSSKLYSHTHSPIIFVKCLMGRSLMMPFIGLFLYHIYVSLRRGTGNKRCEQLRLAAGCQHCSICLCTNERFKDRRLGGLHQQATKSSHPVRLAYGFPRILPHMLQNIVLNKATVTVLYVLRGHKANADFENNATQTSV